MYTNTFSHGYHQEKVTLQFRSLSQTLSMDKDQCNPFWSGLVHFQQEIAELECN